MRRFALAFLLVAALSTVAQFQPIEAPDFSGNVVREDLTSAGEMDGIERFARFIHASDAHIIDDDAPFPIRVDALDDVFYAPGVSDGAARPHEEFTDEVLNAMIQSINAVHLDDELDFVVNTGDNIDNQLENELMRFIDNWEGTFTTTGPISETACEPDGQSEGLDDDENDASTCTHLPDALAQNNVPLVSGLPWFSAFGNHDGLIQGNVPKEPSFQDIAENSGRYLLEQTEYVAMHFRAGTQCLNGAPAGNYLDDYGHGYGFAGSRLCDEDPDNDGYYSFELRGVRYIVLDTINDDFVTGNSNLNGVFAPQTTLGYDLVGGYAEGAIDPAQYAWFLNEIDTNQDKLIVVFSHHTVNSMFPDEVRPVCCGPNGESLEDLLLEAGYATGPGIEADLAERPNVVAWLGGHTHQHRIQAKQTFWNVESSSIVDLPQQVREVELWRDANGTKGFIALNSVDHDFQQSKDLAASDEQFDADAAAGTELDGDVLLWFDIPAGVKIEPQPSLPRNIVLNLDSGGPYAPGDNATVTLRATDNLQQLPVPGLDIQIDVRHTLRDGTRVDDVEQTLPEVAPGLYQMTFPLPDAATYFVTITAVDPTGVYPGASKLASISVLDDDIQIPGKKSPGLAVGLLVGGLVLLARRR